MGKALLDRRVLKVMGKVPRHDFVRLELQPFACDDMPLPGGYGKTISKPPVILIAGQQGTSLELVLQPHGLQDGTTGAVPGL